MANEKTKENMSASTDKTPPGLSLHVVVDFGFIKPPGPWTIFYEAEDVYYIVPVRTPLEKDGKKITVEHRIYLVRDQIQNDLQGRPGHHSYLTELSLKDVRSVETEDV